MTHISHKQRDAVVVSVLAAVVGTFAYSLFVLHADSPQFAHGFDVSAPLLLERAIAFLRGAAE